MTIHNLLSLFFLTGLLFTCQASKGMSSGENMPSVSESSKENSRDLTDYIRRMGEAYVTGEGDAATISIRGITTINGDPNPLFVLNGNIIGRSYHQVYHMVAIPQLASVRILKDAGDIAFYGMQGSNGVVEITLK